jgi:hypothetical protein
VIWVTPEAPGEETLHQMSGSPGTGAETRSWLTSHPRDLLLCVLGVLLALLLGWLAGHSTYDAVALTAGLGMIVMVLVRPQLGAMALVAFVPALSGLVPGVPVASVRISELLIGAIGLTLLVTARRSTAVGWGALDWLLLAYGLLWALDGVVAAFAGHQHLSLANWGTVAGQLQFFLLYRSLKVTLGNQRERRLALKILFISSAAVALLAVLQEARVPGVGNLIATMTGSTQGGNGTGGLLRATGPFVNWAALAGYLLPLILVAVCLGLGGSIRRHKTAAFLLVVLLTVALFFTAELSVIACLVLGVGVLGVRHGRGRVIARWLGIGAAVVVLVGGVFLVQRLDAQLSTSAGSNRSAGVPQTLNMRWSVWTQQYIPAVEQRPLTGYGVVLPPSIRWPFPESQYIAYLIDGGLPLLAVFGFLCWAMYVEAKRASRSPDQVDRSLGQALGVAVISMAVVNVIWPYLSNGGMPQVLWCLFALLPAAVPKRSSWEMTHRVHLRQELV